MPAGDVGWSRIVDKIAFARVGDSFVLVVSKVVARLEALVRSCRHLLEADEGVSLPALVDLLREHGGNHVLTLWDGRRRVLHLARPLLSSVPLFFQVDPRQVSFASLPTGLIEAGGGTLRLAAVADWYGALVGAEIGAMFSGVEKVDPGTIVSVGGGSSVVTRYSSAMTAGRAPFTDHDEAAATIRTAFEAAVGDCLEDAETTAGSLLSAGRDSSAVTMFAAAMLDRQGGTLEAITYSSGATEECNDQGQLIDEWFGARRIAERAANLRHHRVIPRDFKLCEALDSINRHHCAPLGNPISLSWWDGVQQRAAASGCRVLLTGGAGNLTVSDGGTFYLADLVSAGKFRLWSRAFQQTRQCPTSSDLSLLKNSFGGFIPLSLYRRIQGWRGQARENPAPPFLRPPLTERIADIHRAQDERPPRRGALVERRLLTNLEVGDVAPDLRFGLSMRDPTADLRVVEACLRVPPALLVSRYDRRPIFERLVGDLLPMDIVRAPRRGYQNMDWNLAYDRVEIVEGIERYASNPLVTELVDFGEVRAAMREWPEDRFSTVNETSSFGYGLFRALALASFIDVHCSNFTDD